LNEVFAFAKALSMRRILKYGLIFVNHNGKNIFGMRYKICICLLVLGVGYLATSCAMLDNNDNVGDAEISELHGDHHVFWPYENAGFSAAERGDRITARQLYLRAYRNTGLALAGAPPSQDSTIRNMMFGQAANLTDVSKAHAYAEKLDALTPLPGAGQSTNDILDTAVSYQRSMAAYNWALNAGHLGDFEAAEQAFLYSLRLEESRKSEFIAFIASCHFELARLYDAWGKPGLSIEHYRNALPLVSGYIKFDPLGYAMVLDDFAAVLDEAGQSVEASQIRKQSDELRKNNPGKKARFQPEPYPKRTAS
jgi:tetratricopeptide (TPR) repeat protein